MSVKRRYETCSDHIRNIERITTLESEVSAMAEKMDKMLSRLDEIGATVTRWTVALGIYSGLASAAVVVVLEWDKLKAWLS